MKRKEPDASAEKDGKPPATKTAKTEGTGETKEQEMATAAVKSEAPVAEGVAASETEAPAASETAVKKVPDDEPLKEKPQAAAATEGTAGTEAVVTKADC